MARPNRNQRAAGRKKSTTAGFPFGRGKDIIRRTWIRQEKRARLEIPPIYSPSSAINNNFQDEGPPEVPNSHLPSIPPTGIGKLRQQNKSLLFETLSIGAWTHVTQIFQETDTNLLARRCSKMRVRSGQLIAY